MKRLNRTIFAKPIRVFGKGFNIANKIVAGIGHLFSAMSSIFTGITNLLVLGIGLLILAGFLLAFISSAIGIIVSAFDFSAHEKDIRENRSGEYLLYNKPETLALGGTGLVASRMFREIFSI